MIEQDTIATTPKYNFPQPAMDATLPKRFMELSLHSLEQVQNQDFQLIQQDTQETDNTERNVLGIKRPPIMPRPRYEETIVAAVDTSTINIGETSSGVLIAVRGANVWKQKKLYRYMRLGPFIFHLTDENKGELYDTLQRTYFHSPSMYDHHSCSSLLQVPMRIAALLERWLQSMLSKTVRHGIVLFDGSLTAGTPDTPIWLLKEILTMARARENVVMAFSKMTTLRVSGHLITELPVMKKPPLLFEIDGFRFKPPTMLMGCVYAAKLSLGNCAFRLDIDKDVAPEQRITGVERLLGNDVTSQSYPETLRLAHILCTFTANEVLAMQHFIALKYGLRLINRPNMHSLLFGPFGKGEYS